MNAPSRIEVELVSETETFFAPTSFDVFDSLLGEYRLDRERIDRVSDVLSGDLSCVLHYFGDRALSGLFDVNGAVAKLNASYWSRALSATDVRDFMPQDRRKKWDASIMSPQGERSHNGKDEWSVDPLPEFNESTVRSTINGLLAMRQQFFAERVDGIFRKLSNTHVTNVPEGFGKRMILANVIMDGSTNSNMVGYIYDLRCVIAKFMGRTEPRLNVTDPVVKAAFDHSVGEWVSLDGGSLRLRLYKKGTAHLEVHPDMAYRLNQVLAHMHPFAIPTEFRIKPAKKAKEWPVINRPLPFGVIEQLVCVEPAREYSRELRRFVGYLPNALCLRLSSLSDAKEHIEQTKDVLRSIGGVEDSINFCFNYDPFPVIRQIVASGCLPDQHSHQFYGTPQAVAECAVDAANDDAEPGMSWVEPSAGQGGLADHMPKDNLLCVELSDIHCAILRAKGHNVKHADFLQWKPDAPVDRIVMNPPYSEGRWQAHVAHARSLLSSRGVLVAVLPQGAHRTIEGAESIATFDRAFEGTSISVSVVRIRN